MQDKNPYAASKVATTREVSPQLATQPRDFGIGEVLGLGFTAVKNQPVELIGGFALTIVLTWAIQQVPQLALLMGVLPADAITAAALVALASALLGGLASAYFSVGQLRVALSAARGEPVEFAQFFSGGDRFGTMFLMNLLTAFGMIVGLLLFVIPGLVLALGWSLASAFVSDTDCSASEALSESWGLTKGFKLKLFFFVGATVLVVLLGLLCLGVGFFVALPTVVIAYAVIYMRLTGNVQSQQSR